MNVHRDFFISIALALVIAYLLTAGCMQGTTSKPSATIEPSMPLGTPPGTNGTRLSPPVTSPDVPLTLTSNGTVMNITSTPDILTSTPSPEGTVTSVSIPAATTVQTVTPASAVAVSITGTPDGTGTPAQTPVTVTWTTVATIQTPPASTLQSPVSATGTVIAILSGESRYSHLVGAFDAAGMVSTLTGPGPFTIFAPTNDAFNSLPAGSMEDLLADPGGELTDILKYHVVPGKYTRADLSGVKSLTTLQGEMIAVEVVNGTVTIDEIRVIIPDIDGGNGVIHGIEGVLIPSTL